MTSSENNIVEIKLSYQEEFIVSVAEVYANNSEFIEKFFVISKPFVCCMIDVYNYCLGKGMIRIEDLEEGMKQELMKHSLRIQPIEIKKNEDRRNLCRCIWLLNYVFEKYFV